MAADDPSARDIFDPSANIDPPAARPLRVYAYDPSQGRRLGNCMQAQIRYEKLAPGPVGSRFAVVDYDGAQKTYYLPVDLDDPLVLIQGGLAPSEVDPRFHQQMVYAVANETLERFEAALGRRVHWRRPVDDAGKTIYGRPNRLYLHPHAMRQENAFYSPDAHAILFGYFQADADDPGQNLPGQTVFTCLSHDIIAHETTHAIVDGVRPYLMEPTNIDVPAFHEAFADLAALFRHFSHRETLLDTLQRTGGRLYDLHLKADGEMGGTPDGGPMIQADIAKANPLIALANQFGEASGLHGGLRSALGTPPKPDAIKTTVEAHARGAILVSAVFDAYFTIYMAKTAPLFRINRAAQGTRDDLPQPLAELLAAEASKTANMFFSICARALDYCPPVDLTFGDFLRALITADIDFYPDDTDGVRDALMQAFRLRGITADEAQYFSEGSLCWPRLAPDALVLPYLKFGDPNGLTRKEQDENGNLLRAWAKANAERLGFDPKVEIEVPSFHPMFRIAQSGELKIDMVVELIQTTYDPPEGELTGAMPLRAGMTLIVAKPSTLDGDRAPPHVRYAIPKHLTPARVSRQRAAFGVQGVTAGKTGRFAIDFALLHQGG
jgi:hypothetical protein